VFSGDGMDWDEDGADSNHKNARRMVIAVQEGSWRADRGFDCQLGGVIQVPGANRVERGSLNGVYIKFGSFGFPALSRCQE